jgi:hypothetical protein
MIGAYGALFHEQALARRAAQRPDPFAAIETAPA